MKTVLEISALEEMNSKHVLIRELNKKHHIQITVVHRKFFQNTNIPERDSENVGKGYLGLANHV